MEPANSPHPQDRYVESYSEPSRYRSAEVKKRMSLSSIWILSGALLLAGTAISLAWYFKPDHEVVAMSGRNVVFVVNKATGNVKLCGPEACVPVPERNPRR